MIAKALHKNKFITDTLNKLPQFAALALAAVIILLMLMPNIGRCIENSSRFRHLDDMYKINDLLAWALEQESKTSYNPWHKLLDEHNSEKLLHQVSADFFKGKLKTSDYYAENDGSMLSISSIKYPEMQSLKIKIPQLMKH